MGMLTAAPVMMTVADTPEAQEELSTATLAEPLVAHVRDLTTGEISLMVGEREIIFRDPGLVVRLLNAMH
jgi:hypothetical protein